MWWWVLLACGGSGKRDTAPDPTAATGATPTGLAPATGTPGGTPTGTTASGSGSTGVPPLPWDDDPCAGRAATPGGYGALFDRWDRQPTPAGQLVVVGSSTMRRWETAARELAPWGVVQRGFGGAWIGEIAPQADRLVLQHAPAGVVVFAGTNDVAGGATVDRVVDDTRCLLQRIHEHAPGTPVFYVTITPTPARWAGWAQADAVNAAVSAWLAQHPHHHLVDPSADFLATGSPPDAALFVDDGLHLSEDGYALWAGHVRAAVDAMLAQRPPPSGPFLAPGSLVRVDLGPANADDGWLAPPVDGFGIHWNAWPDADGGAQIVAGEALRGLVSTTGEATGVDLVVSGGFRCNGLQNGGLAAPSGDRLGTMAVPEATADFFYVGHDADDPGALQLTGLEPGRTHRLRLFASRADAERRVTRYVVHGADRVEGVLVTSGTDIGADGHDGNDDTVLVLEATPDAWGQLWVDVRVDAGAYGYLSLLELEVVP